MTDSTKGSELFQCNGAQGWFSLSQSEAETVVNSHLFEVYLQPGWFSLPLCWTRDDNNPSSSVNILLGMKILILLRPCFISRCCLLLQNEGTSNSISQAMTRSFMWLDGRRPKYCIWSCCLAASLWRAKTQVKEVSTATTRLSDRFINIPTWNSWVKSNSCKLLQIDFKVPHDPFFLKV